MIPQVFYLGPIPINSFGLMLVLGILAAGRRLALTLEENGYDPELAERSVFWAALWGVIGARVLYVITYYETFLANPLDAVFGGAGFVFFGSIFFGFAAVCWIIRKEEISLARFLDYTAVPLAIGYAIGRIGCHLSGDGDYGMSSTLPWAFRYHLGVVPTPVGVTVHPTPIYETFVSLMIAWLLLRWQKSERLKYEGQLFAVYFVLSSIERFAVEFIRIEPRIWMGLTQAQVISLSLITCATLYILSASKWQGGKSTR